MNTNWGNINNSIIGLDWRVKLWEEKPDETSDTSNLNDSIINLESQIDSITVPYYTSDISNLHDSIINLQSQIDRIVVPNYRSHINRINCQISIMNQSITELQDIIGDGNSIDLTHINNSIASLHSQIDSMNNSKLITTKVSNLENYYRDMKTCIWNTLIILDSRMITIQNQIDTMNISDHNKVIKGRNDSSINW
jgi:hypothetical protein